MIPDISDWKNNVADTISTIPIQPSEFWRMDTEELSFWHKIAIRKIEGIERSLGKKNERQEIFMYDFLKEFLD